MATLRPPVYFRLDRFSIDLRMEIERPLGYY
jgi:hypothetical protein